MLTRLEVRNWQSLRLVDLELGSFTVIVGPSSSGKSALMRACRALASNVRGNGMTTRGQKHTAITAHTETQTITLERTDTAGTYRILTSGNELTFTKLNGGVPDAVTQALGVEPVPANGVSVNFAGQFDRPYLLDDSGATVARVLGELTRVNTIFEAVRAANKIRLNAASTLKTRKNDLQSVKDKLKDFHGLADRIRTLETIESHAGAVSALDDRIEKLEKATRMLQLSEAALDKASQLPRVPSPEAMNNALHRYLNLQAQLNGVASKVARATAFANEAASAETRLIGVQKKLNDILAEAGACPTCGQVVP